MNEWLQIFTIIVGNAGIIYMFRKENRDDQSSLSKDIRDDQKRIDDRWYKLMESIRQENRSFHDRLIEIEKSRKTK